MSAMVVRWDSDEQVTILIDGDHVLSVTHDAVGWDGMEAVIAAARHVARRLGIDSIEVEGTPNL